MHHEESSLCPASSIDRMLYGLLRFYVFFIIKVINLPDFLSSRSWSVQLTDLKMHSINRGWRFKVLTRINKEWEARRHQGHIKATDIMEGVFHGNYYRVTSAWSNIICLTSAMIWGQSNHPSNPSRALEIVMLQRHRSVLNFVSKSIWQDETIFDTDSPKLTY